VRPQTIAMFNLNATKRDPRVLRIGGSLVGAGHRVVVFEMRAAEDAECEMIDGIEIRRVTVPMRYDEEDMAEFRSPCRQAFDLIERCDPRVVGRNEKNPGRHQSRYRLWSAAVRHWRGNFPPHPVSDDDRREIVDIRSIMLINLALYKAAVPYRPTLVHCNDLDTLLIGYMFKCNHKLPVVFDAHEIYPEQLSPEVRSDIWYHFYTMLEDSLIQLSDGRITVCDSLGKYFAERYDATGFITVLNVPFWRSPTFCRAGDNTEKSSIMDPIPRIAGLRKSSAPRAGSMMPTLCSVASGGTKERCGSCATLRASRNASPLCRRCRSPI
jgi:Glycosyl transferase 4-like domain